MAALDNLPGSGARMLRALDTQSVPVRTPLKWAIFDADGTLLYPAGTVISRDADRAFLFVNFTPSRMPVPGEHIADPVEKPASQEDAPLLLDSINLIIGASLGIRPLIGSYDSMHQARLIGYTTEHYLFVTPPPLIDPAATFTPDETVEIVAIANQGVFHFNTRVIAVNWHPSPYLVLAQPEKLQPLRIRQSTRPSTRFAVHYDTTPNQDTYDRLGVVTGVSAYGLSLETPRRIGTIGTRVRLSFLLRSQQLELPVKTSGVIRNVRGGDGGGDAIWEAAVHGIELDQLTTAQQTAVKAYAFDQQNGIQPSRRD